MAFLTCNFFSESLEISTEINVILPDISYQHFNASNFPVLYLLHGLSDDHTMWMRKTSIERYAAAKGIAVVMPAANRSFYSDMMHGARYWTFISEELPNIVSAYFSVSTEREDTFAAGLSMGGYGAFKLALNFPEKFAAAASLSGALKLETTRERFPEDYHNIFGTATVNNTIHDLYHLVEIHKNTGLELPALYQCCGTEDFLYDINAEFKRHCENNNVTLTYEEGPGGHEWAYWDKQIERVIQWLPVRKK